MLLRKLKRKRYFSGKLKLYLLFVFLFVIAGLFRPFAAYAVDFTWDGGGDGTSWVDELNWTADSGYPDDNGDAAVFNSGSDSVSTPATALTIGGMLLNYSGTLTLGADLILDDSGAESGLLALLGGTLDTSASDYAITADGDVTISGTLIANGSTITCGGNWDSSAGTFTYGTSKVTFTGTSGTQQITSDSESFYNVDINNSGTSVQLVDTLTQVSGGALTVTAGTLDLNGQTLTLGADLSIATGTIAVGTGTLDGATNSADITIGGTITQGTGTLNCVILILQGSGSYTCTGASVIEVSGGVSLAGVSSTFSAGSSTFTMTGAGTTMASSFDLNNFIINSSDTITLNSNITVGGDLTITAGTLDTNSDNDRAINVTGNVDIDGTLTANGSTITVGGDWDSSGGTFTIGTSTVKMTGSGKNFTANGWQSRAYNLTIGDGVNPASVTVSYANWRYVARNNLILADNASLILISAFDYLPADGTLTLGTGATLNISTNLTRNINDSSSHISTTGSFGGAGTFEYNIASGSVAAPVTARTYGCYLSVSGAENAVAVLGGGTSLDLGTKTLRMYDSNTNNATYGILDNPGNIPVTGGDLEIAQSGDYMDNRTGKLIARGAVYTFNNVNVYATDSSTNATIDCLTGGESSTWNVSGNVGTYGGKTYKGIITAGASNWTVGGNWTNGGTFTADTSTVDFDASGGTQTLDSGGTGTGQDFNNLTHSGAGTLQLITNDLDIDAVLTNSGGTLDLNAKTITLNQSANAMSNTATIIETGDSKIVHAATSCLLTDSSGNEVSSYMIGTDSIYVRVVDEDENLGGTVRDTLTGVTVTGGTSGDSETLTLTETGDATEIFLSSSLTTAGYDGSSQANDGTLELSHGETITVTYTDDEDNTDNNTSDTATCRLAVANFFVSASSPQVAGIAFTYTITAREADGTTDLDYNRTANITLTYVTPSSGTKTLSTASTFSFTNGVATVSETYNDAGVISITARDTSDSSIYGTSSNITFVPDSFTVSVSKSTIAVNEPFTLTLTAKNSAGNTTANYQDKATLSINYITPSTSQNGSLSTTTLAASNWSSGVAKLTEFTYNKFGIITITCTDPTDTTQTGTSSSITFLPQELYIEPVSPSGGRDFYYQGEDITVTVTVQDYNGSAIGNYTGDVEFSGDNLSLPSTYSFNSVDSGTHIFTGISGISKGTTSIAATDATYSTVTGTFSDITIKEGTIIVRNTSGPVTTLPVTVDLIDSDGQDIIADSGTTFTVTLLESRDDDTASCPATTTKVMFNNGTAEIKVTDTQAEVVTVTPVAEDYLNVVAGKVSFGGAGVPNFGSGFRVKWWRELRQNEAR